MKEAIGGGWLFTLVIAFIALFSAFISLSVNYSKCYKVKDEILSAIEREHGINEDSLTEINEYLLNIGYRNSGVCPRGDGCWVPFSVTKNNGPSGYGGKTNFCVKRVDKTEVTKTKKKITTNAALGHPESAYYGVTVFFALDVPVIRSVFNIRIQGETSLIYLLNDFNNVEKGTACA